jgi:hypothetical protein
VTGGGGWWAEHKAARVERRAKNAEIELVTAAVLPTEAEARLAAASLENNGIPATVQLDQPVMGIKWAEAARVIVQRRDLEKAREFLR